MYSITVTSPPFKEPVELKARDSKELILTVLTVLGACWDWSVNRGDIRSIVHRHYDHWLNGIAGRLTFPHTIDIDTVKIVVAGEEDK